MTNRTNTLSAEVATANVPLTCQNCGKRPSTQNFTSDPTAMAHGWVQRWCDICVLQAQIKHAKQRAKALPGMERKLARLLARETRKAKR